MTRPSGKKRSERTRPRKSQATISSTTFEGLDDWFFKRSTKPLTGVAGSPGHKVLNKKRNDNQSTFR